MRHFGGLALAYTRDYLKMSQQVTQMNLSLQWYFQNVQKSRVRSPKICRLSKYCMILTYVYFFSLWSCSCCFTPLIVSSLSLQRHGEQSHFSWKPRFLCNPFTSLVVHLPRTMSSQVLNISTFLTLFLKITSYCDIDSKIARIAESSLLGWGATMCIQHLTSLLNILSTVYCVSYRLVEDLVIKSHIKSYSLQWEKTPKSGIC